MTSLPQTAQSSRLNLARLAIAAAIALPVALATASPAAATADGPDRFRVVNVVGNDTLNLRAWPSYRSRILKRIPFNGRRLINEARFKRGWTKISYDGRTGWVRNKFLAEETRRRRTLFKVVRVRRHDTLRLRARPRRGAFVLGKIGRYAAGLVYRGECRNNYCKVRYGAMRGWVSKSHIAVQGYGRPHRSSWFERRRYLAKRVEYLRSRWTANWYDRFDDYYGRDARPASLNR